LLQLLRVFGLEGQPGRRPRLLHSSLLLWRRWRILWLILSERREGSKSGNDREAHRYDQSIAGFHLITTYAAISIRYHSAGRIA
jgi:hypothetical protein